MLEDTATATATTVAATVLDSVTDEGVTEGVTEVDSVTVRNENSSDDLFDEDDPEINEVEEGKNIWKKVLLGVTWMIFEIDLKYQVGVVIAFMFKVYQYKYCNM